MKKYIILSLLIVLVFLNNPINASAISRTVGDLYDELASLEAEKAAQDSQKALTQAEYDKVSQEIIDSQKKIEDYNTQIVQATNDIIRLGGEIEIKKEETDKILVFLELSSGEKSYLEYIFKATSFTDFIHRVSIVEELSKYNKDQIKEMNDLIKQNEELKIKLANAIKEVEAERLNLEESRKKIGSRIGQLNQEGATIEESIESMRNRINDYAKMGCTDRSDVLSECMGIPSSSGFLRPITNGIVTDWYGPRIHPITGAYQSTHTGIDISDSGWPVGKSIYPVAAGTVAFKTHWSCGGNVLGVYHVVNGVSYTSMYLHLNGYNVEVGDIVSENDVIAFMGGTSDNCSTGPHVHLTMAYGHVNAYNYYNYIFDPKTLIYFPDGWFYSRSW